MNLKYNKAICSNKVENCDRKKFKGFLESKTLRESLDKYRTLLADISRTTDEAVLKSLEKTRERMKKTLFPMFLPQAWEFDGDVRSKENAREGVLVAGDYDHCDVDVRSYFDTLRKSEDFKAAGIVFAEVSVSGEGLHVWALRQRGENLAVAQERLARTVGLKHDAAMEKTEQGQLLSGDVFYYDETLMWDSGITPECLGVSSPSDSPEGVCTVSAPPVQETEMTADVGNELFKGAPISMIVEKLVEETGGAIHKGERHTRLVGLAYALRNICDYRPERLCSILSLACEYDDRTDLMRICSDACKDAPSKKMPYRLNAAIRKARAEYDTESIVDERVLSVNVPQTLPRIFRLFLSKYSPEYAPALVMVLLTMFGFLATRVRCMYNRGTEEHPLSFMTFISAPFACGKSFVRSIVDIVLRKVKAESRVLLQKENEWKRDTSAKKQSKKKGEESSAPKFPIRYVSAKMSNTEFMNRLANAEGKHLFFFEEEFGTLVKSARRGSAYEFWDIYRLAFDGAENKQNFFSAESMSGIEKTMLNFIVCGTPKLLSKELGKHVEDGLTSRLAIAKITQTLGAEQPLFKNFSSKELQEIEDVCDMLSELNETVTLKKVWNSIDGWIGQQKKTAMKTYSVSRFALLKRAAVMGYRAGVIGYYLAGRKENKGVVDLALFVAEYVLRQQLEMFGDIVEKEFGEDTIVTNESFDYYAALPDTFRCCDLRALRMQNGASANIAAILRTWKNGGLIEPMEESKTYRKISV